MDGSLNRVRRVLKFQEVGIETLEIQVVSSE